MASETLENDFLKLFADSQPSSDAEPSSFDPNISIDSDIDKMSRALDADILDLFDSEESQDESKTIVPTLNPAVNPAVNPKPQPEAVNNRCPKASLTKTEVPNTAVDECAGTKMIDHTKRESSLAVFVDKTTGDSLAANGGKSDSSAEVGPLSPKQSAETDLLEKTSKMEISPKLVSTPEKEFNPKANVKATLGGDSSQTMNQTRVDSTVLVTPKKEMPSKMGTPLRSPVIPGLESTPIKKGTEQTIKRNTMGSPLLLVDSLKDRVSNNAPPSPVPAPDLLPDKNNNKSLTPKHTVPSSLPSVGSHANSYQVNFPADNISIKEVAAPNSPTSQFAAQSANSDANSSSMEDDIKNISASLKNDLLNFMALEEDTQTTTCHNKNVSMRPDASKVVRNGNLHLNERLIEAKSDVNRTVTIPLPLSHRPSLLQGPHMLQGSPTLQQPSAMQGPSTFQNTPALKGPSSLMQHGPSLVQGPSSLIQHGPSLIQGPSSLIQHGSSLLQGPSSLIQHRSSTLQGPSLIQHGSSQLQGQSSLVHHARPTVLPRTFILQNPAILRDSTRLQGPPIIQNRSSVGLPRPSQNSSMYPNPLNGACTGGLVDTDNILPVAVEPILQSINGSSVTADNIVDDIVATLDNIVQSHHSNDIAVQQPMDES